MAMARANMNKQVSTPPMKRPKSKMKAFDEFLQKEWLSSKLTLVGQ